MRKNVTKDDKKVTLKKVPLIGSFKLKEDMLLNNPFYSLINQTEKKNLQEKKIKIVPSSDPVLRLKERIFLAANIKGLEGSANLSSYETDKTIMMVQEEIGENNQQDEININEELLNKPNASSPKHTKKYYEKGLVLYQLPEGS